MPTTPAPEHLDSSRRHQSPTTVESDTDSVPRFTAAEKAKQKDVPILEDEVMRDEPEPFLGEDEMAVGSMTPTAHAVAEVKKFAGRWKFCS